MRKNRAWSSFLLLLLFPCLLTCGKLIYSPFIALAPNEQINKVNLHRINDLVSTPRFEEKFKIAILSDNHEYYADLKRQINYINKKHQEFAFVIHLGDATNTGLVMEYEEFYNAMKKILIPYILVIGNHDMLNNGKEIYQQLYGFQLNFSFSFKNVNFIIFNNNNWESENQVPDLSYVSQELINSSSPFNILLSHQKIDDKVRFSKNTIKKMKQLVNHNKVNYLINGHKHNPAQGQFGHAIRLTAGASHKRFMLILTVSTKGIEHEFIKI